MEVKDAIKFLESIGYSASGYGNSYISGDTEKYETPTSLGVRFVEVRKLTELLKSLEAEKKALKKFKDMWEWIQGVEMWNKEYEKIVKEVVQDIEVGYESGKVIEKIGYEKVEDKGLDDGIFNKQNQRYIKKINTFKKLKKENETYKGMWEMLSGIANRETDTSFESELFSIITRIENHYLGGGE